MIIQSNHYYELDSLILFLWQFNEMNQKLLILITP